MRRFFFALLPLLLSLISFALPTGCDRQLDAAYYYYEGPLNARHAGKLVIESYQTLDGKLRLTGADIDLDGDKKLDLTVSIGTDGQIESIVAADDNERRWAYGKLERLPVRPKGFDVSPALVGLADVYELPPSKVLVDELYGTPAPAASRAWQLAVALRNSPSPEVFKLIQQRAGYALRNARGPLVRQSAFILAGCGAQGVIELAKTLRDATTQRNDIAQKLATEDPKNPLKDGGFLRMRVGDLERAAEHIAFALLSVKTPLTPVLNDLVETLNINTYGNVQYNLFKALEAEAKQRPFEIKRRIFRLREIARGRDEIFSSSVENLAEKAQDFEGFEAKFGKRLSDPTNDRILENQRRLEERGTGLTARPAAPVATGTAPAATGGTTGTVPAGAGIAPAGTGTTPAGATSPATSPATAPATAPATPASSPNGAYIGESGAILSPYPTAPATSAPAAPEPTRPAEAAPPPTTAPKKAEPPPPPRSAPVPSTKPSGL